MIRIMGMESKTHPLNLLRDFFCVGQKFPALRRGHHTFGAALEQRKSQGVFQVLDSLAQRWLGHK